MRRILAVDDDKDILDVIQYILEDSGYEVEALSDGSLLFDKIKANTPDLILLDIMLGNLDGRDLCRAVKNSAETRDIPVVMISASHAASSIDQKGAPDAFIAKPFDIDDLLGVIEGHLKAA
ncbi:MAG: response regulator [Bacteroidota bacterium]